MYICQIYRKKRMNIMWKDSWTCLDWQQCCLQTSQWLHLCSTFVWYYIFTFVCLTLHLCIIICASSPHIQNSDKFVLRTAYINLVQGNTAIIDRHKNLKTLSFKEALKIKELNPILNFGLKASKKLQLIV